MMEQTGQSLSPIVSKDLLTDQIISQYSRTPFSQVKVILDSARSAQRTWATRPIATRIAYLREVQKRLYAEADSWIDLIHAETGKPKIEALGHEVLPALDYFNFAFSEMPKAFAPRKIQMRYLKHRKSTLNFEPYGAVAVISPWNFPLAIPIGQIIPALLAGNSVVLKPSEYTLSIGKKLVQLFTETSFPELPANLVQIVIGDASEGAALVAEGPDKIFFTGSTSAGKAIMRSASSLLTPLCLELGGKDALVVLADANLPYTAKAAAWGLCTNAGQACASVERIYVHETVAAPFRKLLIQELRALRQDTNSLDNPSDVGPITMPRQASVYQKQLQDAKDRGLVFHVGGSLSQSGKYMQPTLLEIETNNSQGQEAQIANEETFGPIAVLRTFRSKQEAVRLVNDSSFGLLASVFSQNLKEAEDFAKELQVGTVTINEVLYTHGLAETPWVGRKQSGYGISHSKESFKEYVQIKHIHSPRYQWLSRPPFCRPSPWWFPYSLNKYNFFRSTLALLVEEERMGLKNILNFLKHSLRFLFQK